MRASIDGSLRGWEGWGEREASEGGRVRKGGERESEAGRGREGSMRARREGSVRASEGVSKPFRWSFCQILSHCNPPPSFILYIWVRVGFVAGRVKAFDVPAEALSPSG